MNHKEIPTVIHRSRLSCRVLESKLSAQQGTVTQVCGPVCQGKHACFNNQLQESLAASKWIITRLIFLFFSSFQTFYDLSVLCLMSFHFFVFSTISLVCRATSNNKVKEMVLLELSYVNSNLQLLMGQLEGLNSSVEVYQSTQ